MSRTHRRRRSERQAKHRAASHRILRTDQKDAPRLDYDRVRTRPGTHELADTRTLT